MKNLIFVFLIFSIYPEKIQGFQFLGNKVYELNGVKNIISEYQHKKTGMKFSMIKGYKKGIFLISQKEVSKRLWYKIMNPVKLNRMPEDEKNEPVTSVSWKSVKNFCNKTYLDLPTTQQWIYACKGGSKTKYFWGDDLATLTSHVSIPNPYGLYDLVSSVSEWCDNRTNNQYKKYIGPNFYSPKINIYRSSDFHKSVKKFFLGFRVVFNLDKSKNTIKNTGPKTISLKKIKNLRKNETYKNITYLGMKRYNNNLSKVRIYIHKTTQIIFSLIPSGEFLMGGKLTNEQPVHKVYVDSFLMSQHEVTNKIWNATMWKINNQDSLPVTNISWYDAVGFCRKFQMCLPTEAQWEYACRSGSSTEYYWGDRINKKYVHYRKKKLAKIGTKLPNNFGLYDMSGNVSEWCKDIFQEDYYQNFIDNTAINPQGPAIGHLYVFRGGSWNDSKVVCRSAFRMATRPNLKDTSIGFRPCIILK